MRPHEVCSQVLTLGYGYGAGYAVLRGETSLEVLLWIG